MRDLRDGGFGNSRRLVLLTGHEEDGTGSVFEDGVANAAEDEVVERAVAVGAHDDQVAGGAFGFVKDFFRGRALHEKRGDPKAILFEFLADGLQPAMAPSVIFSDVVANGLRSGVIPDELGIRRLDMKKTQRSVHPVGELAGRLDHGIGHIGKIEWHQNGLQGELHIQ